MAEDKQKYELKSNPRRPGKVSELFPRSDSEWSADNFYNWYSETEDLKNLQLDTKEGIDKVYSYVPDPVARKYSPEQVKQGLVRAVSEGLQRNSVRNMQGLAGLVDDEFLLDLSLQTPVFYSSAEGGEPDEDYKKVAKAVENVVNVSKDLENDASQYLERRLEGLDELSKMFWSSFPREILVADQEIAKENALMAMQEYGSPAKFVANNVSRADVLGQKYEQEVRSLETERREKLESKQQELGRELTPYEQAEIERPYNQKRAELDQGENAEAYKLVRSVTGGLMKQAYGSMKKQKEEAEKEKSNKSSKGGSDSGDSGE